MGRYKKVKLDRSLFRNLDLGFSFVEMDEEVGKQ